MKPENSIEFAADYFTHDTASYNYPTLIDNEIRKISRHRVNKMKTKGWVQKVSDIMESKTEEQKVYKKCSSKESSSRKSTAIRAGLVTSEITDKEKVQLQDTALRWLIKLNAGPLSPDVDAKEKLTCIVKKRPKKKKRFYCGGCKHVREGPLRPEHLTLPKIQK